jgi:hypothetical protein
MSSRVIEDPQQKRGAVLNSLSLKGLRKKIDACVCQAFVSWAQADRFARSSSIDTEIPSKKYRVGRIVEHALKDYRQLM